MHLPPARAILPLVLFGLTGCEIAPMQVVPVDRPVTEAPTIPPIPEPRAAAAQVPAGLAAEPVVTGLTYPTSVEVDDEGALWIAEAGYVYGDPSAPTRILRIDPDGGIAVAVEQGLEAPVNDLLWHDGRLLVSHRGKISVLEQDSLRDLVTDLPSQGDHHNNQLAADPSGWIYFGQGTATNSGIVGIDNWVMGWLKTHPDVHDLSPRPLRLRETELVTLDPFVMTKEDETPLVTTGPFAPFGSEAGDSVRGTDKANGAVLRFRVEDPEGTLEVFAWGLRNPYGVEVAGDGRVFVAENGFDDRGSRPIANAPDVLWVVEQGGWYGWPDHAAGERVDQERFQPTGKEVPELLLEQHPPLAGPPLATLPPHTAVAKLAFARHSDAFAGLGGKLVVAELGDMSPMTGTADEPVGHRVTVVDPSTGEARTLLSARRDALGEGIFHHVATAGPRRPIDVVFARDGSALYVVDLGGLVVLPTATPLLRPFEGTGVLWRIAPAEARDLLPMAGIHVGPERPPRTASR